ncbi:hypothetical protein N7540_002709 [Penicillium herquei]|nr:hypothetical protein N7540_002709 [Penicillium herquei]
MLEAGTRRVEWLDIDEDTFTRLCEFAYLRNYTPPSPSSFPPAEASESAAADKEPAREPVVKKRRVTASSQLETEPDPKRQEINIRQNDQSPEYHHSDAPVPTPQPKTKLEVPSKKLRIHTEDLKNVFSKDLVVPNTRFGSLKRTYLPHSNSSASQDFRPVFLGQVRLYIQADKYCIDNLRNLVLYNIFQTLQTFKLFEMGLEWIAELVRFIYGNTRGDHEGSTDAMRNLVTRFVVSVVGQIGQIKCFQDLLNEGGPFVTDFWNIIWKVE